MFSDVGIHNRTKQEILESSKKYIDDLKNANRLESLTGSVPLSTAIGHMFGSYLSLGFQGMEFTEFKEFCDYINETQRLSKIEKMPEAAQTVLDAMQTDVLKFHRMICFDSSYGKDVSEPKYHEYHETPILNYISPNVFIEKLLALAHGDRRYIFWAIGDRYKYENINDKLLEELDWLKSVETLLLEEAERRKGRLSSFCLRLLDTHSLRKAIEKLEVKEGEVTK